MQSVFACFPKKESTLCIIITTGHLFFLALDVLVAAIAIPLESPAPFKVEAMCGPVCVYVCVRVCLCVCMDAWPCVCMCVYIYTCAECGCTHTRA